MIGIIAGNFDVIHPGYIAMFNEMKQHCDHILVLLHTDPTIERPEKCKPVLSVEERLDILQSLRQVDEVHTYTTEAELYDYLKNLSAALTSRKTTSKRFLGDDYKGRSFTGDDLNIPIHYINRDHGWSTTKFKNQIANEVLRSSNV
jgi:glycerol-3-phosphate cytidylyltransferase